MSWEKVSCYVYLHVCLCVFCAYLFIYMCGYVYTCAHISIDFVPMSLSFLR